MKIFLILLFFIYRIKEKFDLFSSFEKIELLIERKKGEIYKNEFIFF